MELVGQLGGAGGEDDPFGEGAGDIELGVVDRVGEFLQGFLAHVGTGHPTGDHHHCRGVEHGVPESGHQVGETGSDRGGDHRDPPAGTEVGIGGVSGHLLVEHGDVVDRVAVSQGVHERQVAVTHQPEDSVDPFALEGAYEGGCAGYLDRVARGPLLPVG